MVESALRLRQLISVRLCGTRILPGILGFPKTAALEVGLGEEHAESA